jgi:hypothetical protein
MKRDVSKLPPAAPGIPNVDAGLDYGLEGCFWVGNSWDEDDYGQNNRLGVVDYNDYGDMPGLWCQWVPTSADTLEWDEGKKFYDYVQWLKWLQTNILDRWGCKLTGEVSWQGEDSDDRGVIYANSGQIESVEDAIDNSGPSWARKK